MSKSERETAQPSRVPPVFATFCRPWLERAAERLPVWGHYPELAEALAARLSATAARTLAAELAACREARILRGSTSAERWRDFEDRHLALPETQARLRTGSPLLIPLLDRIADHFCGNLEEALARLRTRTRDDEAKILRIDTELSDPHARGRAVIGFVFRGGARLVYKPRSVRGEVWWSDFVAWWNASGVSEGMQLLAPWAEDHGDFGWCEFVEAREGPGDPSGWFCRLGAHAAITWLFGIGDCHWGNFIAAGDHPVLVDAECVGSAFWHPRFPGLPANLPVLFTPIWKTPLTAGLFPQWIMPKVAGQPLYLAPGIGGAEDRPLPVKRPVWHGAGTDALHMVLAAGLMPVARGRAGSPTTARDFSEGFRAAARHLLRRHNEIRSWLGSGSAQDPLSLQPRILLRNTTHYQQILEAASGPHHLASAKKRRAALRTISKLPVIGTEEPAGLLEAEMPYLEAQTYPRFVVNAAGTHIVSDDTGSPVLKRGEGSAVTLARESWQSLSEEKIDWCAGILTAACRQAAEPRIRFPDGKDRFLSAAVEIGCALERQVIRSPDGACWLGLLADSQGNVRPQMPGGDFASGSAGVAAFLARLGEASGDPRWLELAVEAMRFADRYWTRWLEFDGTVPWSTFHGAGSLFHAAGQVEVFMALDPIREILERWLDAADCERSWLDLGGDFMEGLPGWVGSLAALSLGFSSARHLLELARPRLLDPPLSAALPTPGLAHGTAGWVMAVIAMARALEDDHALHTTQKTIQTLPERWAHFETRDSVRSNPPGGWCNGAIGLMAAAAEHPATADCARAFFQKSRPWFAGGYGGHHVCCGEAGRILLLARTAKLLPDAELPLEVRRCAEAILDYAGQHRFLILHGIPERLTIPGWLNGISGVGAAMLDAHASEGGQPAPHQRSQSAISAK